LSSAAFSWIASENPNWNAVHGRFQRWIWLDMHVAHHESLLNTVLVHISIELYIHPFAYKCMCMNNYIILYIYMYHYTYNYIYMHDIIDIVIKICFIGIHSRICIYNV
jgi:hypothetical protein